MALISATDFKVQTAAIAVALTAAYKDSVATRFADAVRDPREPLREMMKFMTLDPATGIFTSNDDHVDAVYAGGNSAKGTRQQAQSVTDTAGLAVNNLTIEDAAPADLIMTFNQNVSDLDSMEVKVDAVVVKIASGSAVGNVITLVLAVPVVFGEVVTVSGVAIGISLNQQTMTDNAVTNNVAA